MFDKISIGDNMKEIYLLRHSEGLKKIEQVINSDSLQIINEKNPLSVAGEERANRVASLDEFKNIDIVISSNYVRAMATAKYFANNNDVVLKIVDSFGERIFGVESWSELPENFEKRQFEEIDFKLPNGESRREVSERMYNSLSEVINNFYQDRILIVSHATAITFLLMKLCVLENGNLMFNDKVIIDKDFIWQAPDGFKLTFDGGKLIDISHLSLKF